MSDLERRTDNHTSLIFHTENKPSEIQSTQIGFITQSGKIFAQLRDIKITFRFFEFDDFILTLETKMIKQFFYIFHAIFHR